MKLHEIELYASDTGSEKNFYHDILQLQLKLDQPELKVFDCGVNGIDFNISAHHPQKISLSFIVKDVDALYQDLTAKGMAVTSPKESHLGLKAISMIREDIRIVFHSPTESSPQWLHQLL